jgi:hypothetical protein
MSSDEFDELNISLDAAAFKELDKFEADYFSKHHEDQLPSAAQQAKKSKVWDHKEFEQFGVLGVAGKSPLHSNSIRLTASNFSRVSLIPLCSDLIHERFLLPSPVRTPSLVPTSPQRFTQPLPMKLKADLLEAKHWVFPLNQPRRGSTS